MIKIEFEQNYQGHIFKDAIVLPSDHGLTDAEIEQIKNQRLVDWVKLISREE